MFCTTDTQTSLLLYLSTCNQCSRLTVPFLYVPACLCSRVLQEAVAAAARLRLVRPGSFIVVVEQVHADLCIKLVAVDDLGLGTKPASPGHAGALHGVSEGT